jgi:hypothetical protein
MPGLVPGIHVLCSSMRQKKTWMAGHSAFTRVFDALLPMTPWMDHGQPLAA